MRKKLRNKVESLKLKAKSLMLQIESAEHSLRFPLSALSLSILLSIVSCTLKDAAHEHADTYTCPMHPTVVSDKPGVCPVCAMDLVHKARPGEEVQITEDLAKLIKSTNEVVVANVKTVRGEYKSMSTKLALKGVVTYDERQIFNISSRIGGRLEKVFVKYVFQPVSKGQKIAEVYSAELVSAQREYLYLLKSDPSNLSIIESARHKLSLLGMSDAQLNDLKTKQDVAYTFAVYSPYAGYVISNVQPAPVASGNSVTASPMGGAGMGMGGTKSSASATQVIVSDAVGELIRAGNYVNAGETLFRIVNTDKLWIEFNIPVSMAGQLKKGDPLEVNVDSEAQNLKVDFIEPFFNEGEDFIKVRAYTSQKNLVIGQLFEASFSRQSKESLWLPTASVLHLGNDKIVFVKERGVLKPRKVKVGAMADGFIEIQSGLASGDEVAAEAHYLIDSENFVKTSN